MRKKLPSSASLQAFEAAARHGNFARAAEELSLTEGAISRQIARLESLLNCRLFERTGSRVRLNPNGARYAHHVRETLERYDPPAPASLDAVFEVDEEARRIAGRAMEAMAA